MGALFPPWTNTVSRWTLASALGGVVALGGVSALYATSPYLTGVGDPVAQPIPFDHRHHVADDGIDCRFCHATVETAASAGYPSLSTCMTCHAQIWTKSPLLDPVRAGYFESRTLPWNRVHRLPDFVYFDHSIHLAKGVGCVSCHGRVDQMAQVMKVTPMTMGWCIDCHRAPEANLRPRERLFDLAWPQPGEVAPDGRALAASYDVHTRTSCTTCHR
jgi:hypothetical protein